MNPTTSKAIVLVTLAFALVSSATLPSPQADQTGKLLPLPKCYDATLAPVLQIANNLQQVFQDPELNH